MSGIKIRTVINRTWITVEISTVLPFLVFSCPPDSIKESSNIQPPFSKFLKLFALYAANAASDSAEAGFFNRIATYINGWSCCQPAFRAIYARFGFGAFATGFGSLATGFDAFAIAGRAAAAT